MGLARKENPTITILLQPSIYDWRCCGLSGWPLALGEPCADVDSVYDVPTDAEIIQIGWRTILGWLTRSQARLSAIASSNQSNELLKICH